MDAVAAPGSAALDAAFAAMLAGDEEGFAVLYRAVQPPLLRYLTTLVGQDAPDVAAETWMSVTKDLRSFSGDVDGFRGWVTRIGRNRAVDHLRAQGRRPTVTLDEGVAARLPAGVDVEGLVLDDISTEQALTLISTLPRDQAEAVALRVIVGLDAAEAGAVLGKRPGAVRVAAHRGLRKLADRLAPLDTAPERDHAVGLLEQA